MKNMNDWKIPWLAGFFFFFLANPDRSVFAETFCVNSASDLNLALYYAQANGEDDTIQIAQGTYSGAFVYSSSEECNLTVLGGYAFDCSSRISDPDNTVIDSGEAGPCLVLNSTVPVDFEVQGITFQNGETATNPNGGGLRILSSGGEVVVDSNIFQNNHAGLDGGGLYVDTSSQVAVSDNFFHTNSSGSKGGGCCLNNIDSILLSNNDLRYNDAGNNGGGCNVSSQYGTSTFSNNTIAGNTAYSGGGISVEPTYDHNITFLDNELFGNDATNYGGGLYLRTSYSNRKIDIEFVNNLVFENRSGIDGHGVYARNSYSLAMSNNTFAKNAVLPTKGGGSGGGIYLHLVTDSARADIYNNVFWNNAANSCSDMWIDDDPDGNFIYPHVALYNNNFDQSEDGFCLSQFLPLYPSNLDKQDPLFADEENNDYRLKEGSPCIDAGTDWENAPDTDIDGVARPLGSDFDIGAYEGIYCETDDYKMGDFYFTNFFTCLDNVSGDSTILCHVTLIEGDVDFDSGHVIELQGGYNCDFTDNSLQGYITRIDGMVTISHGTAILENIVVQ